MDFIFLLLNVPYSLIFQFGYKITRFSAEKGYGGELINGLPYQKSGSVNHS